MKRPCIFITDDNPADQELCLLALESAGWNGRVRCLNSGDDLLAALEGVAEEPVLIFLDLKMPGLSGHEVLERIDGRRTPPVVVLTSSDWPEERSRVLAHQAVRAYWTKPPVVGDVARVLDTLPLTESPT